MSTNSNAGSSPVDRKVRTHGVGDGPILTDLDGDLSEPVLMCWYGVENRCIHCGIHDRHYFYCAAQDAPNKHAAPGKYAYPWPGAGKRLVLQHPDAGCPFVSSNVELSGGAQETAKSTAGGPSART
jgi:hypothetical protein